MPSLDVTIEYSKWIVAVTRWKVGHASVGIAEPSAVDDGMTLPTEANMCT